MIAAIADPSAITDPAAIADDQPPYTSNPVEFTGPRQAARGRTFATWRWTPGAVGAETSPEVKRPDGP